MEQKDELVYDQFPPLCAKYPWFVSHEDEEDGIKEHIFYTINNPLLSYRCQIPELLGKRIRGFFHGWVILSNKHMWSIWNPVTSKIIKLPPLILKDGDWDDIEECCLSSSPDDPNSIVLLNRSVKPTFVFCRLDTKRKRLRWTEMSYSKQLKKISINGRLVHGLTCCNSKVYALNTDSNFARFVLLVDIVVSDKEVLIKLRLFGGCPFSSAWTRYYVPIENCYLKGTSTDLFFIIVGFDEETLETICVVDLFKLDTTSINWEEIEALKDFDKSNTSLDDLVDEDFEDLDITRKMWEITFEIKYAMFFVDLDGDCSAFYSPGVALEFGGYIHIRYEMGTVMHSYNLKDKTISLSSMPSRVLPTSHVLVWECRLEGDYTDSKQEENKDDEIVIKSVVDDEVELKESLLMNLPFHILETVLQHCDAVEYMKFRATCKRCHLTAPLIRWRDKSTLKRLHNYSFASPWLMLVNEKQGIITFTDPVFGDKYFMKNTHISNFHGDRIFCSRFGWLLFDTKDGFVFYNPFTSDTSQLPVVRYNFTSVRFSAPPTSNNCIVVGFLRMDICIHFVGQETWRRLHLDFGDIEQYPFYFLSTFYGEDLYALGNKKEVHVFKDSGAKDLSWEKDVSKAPKSCFTSSALHFLTKCDQNLLLVIMGVSGEFFEVFKLDDSTKEWEKIEGLGRHMIYICGRTCLCLEAKIPEMANKIYVPQFHSKNGRMLFYSLETCKYDTFDQNPIEETFTRTSYELYPHEWIEPSWS